MRLAKVALLFILLAPASLLAAELLNWNFDDGTMGPFTALGSGWEVTDGTLHCYTEGFATFSSVLAGEPFWTDYTVGFDVRAEGSVNQTVRFRVADFQDYYEINVRTAPHNDVVLGRMDYNGYEILASQSLVTQLGEWHHIEVTITDYKTTAHVDGDEVFSYIDHAQPQELVSGSIALVCLSGGEVLWQDIWFDNVTVYTQVVAVETVCWSGIKELFRPAGMKEACFIGSPGLDLDRVPLDNRGGGVHFAYGTTLTWGYRGMGGAVATAREMLLWDKALRGKKILSKKAKAKYYRAGKDDYALGW